MDTQKDETHLLFQFVQSIIHSLSEHGKAAAAIQKVVVKLPILLRSPDSRLPTPDSRLPNHSMSLLTSSPVSHSTASVLLPNLVSGIFLHLIFLPALSYLLSLPFPVFALQE